MTMSPRGQSPFEVPELCAPVTQVRLGQNALHPLHSDAVLNELARLVGSSRTLKKTERTSIGRARYKVWPGAIVAFYNNCLAVATTHHAILHAQPNGGGMFRREIQAQAVLAMPIGGAGIKVSVNVWTSAMCGPIRTSNPADVLAETPFSQLAISQDEKWCAPLTISGKLVCHRCNLRFSSGSSLWLHGKVPATSRRLKKRLPAQPLLRGPPPRHFAQGSIANPRAARMVEVELSRLLLIRGKPGSKTY